MTCLHLVMIDGLFMTRAISIRAYVSFIIASYCIYWYTNVIVNSGLTATAVRNNKPIYDTKAPHLEPSTSALCAYACSEDKSAAL